MFYSPGSETSGLPHNPFKSCCVPRPIGWISTVSAAGVHNLAPYSQFQNLTWDPPTVMVAANARADGSPKDTAANILATGEFVWNMATYDLREWVVGSSRDWASGVDEFSELSIPWVPSVHVAPRRVAGSPVQFECRLTQQLRIPGNTAEASAWLLVGQVVGIHIDDAALTPAGQIDITRLKPLARMGYRDYTCIERVFELSEFTGRQAAGIAHLQEVLHA
ncbi:flavin reductase family protein [Variovorax terrae]|uniref:Flavin reductase family protein n=1 Tax=Variovorax terrae TaxID=2923278 RepID=A0A9X1VZ19_9BURK|nr:flavin reductase family protein [Variovorax terrae]MCJ0764789.1 flavin reductase family protein [Variovorax terrae]